MAKSLRTLIRIREWNVDEKKRELGLKLNALALLEEKSMNLKKELEQEQAWVASCPEMFGFFYENYGTEVIRKQAQIDKDIYIINKQINELRSNLNEAYCELKKFDVIAKNRTAKVNREINLKEQMILDDLGIINFLNKGS